jgi:hypothetical protein
VRQHAGDGGGEGGNTGEAHARFGAADRDAREALGNLIVAGTDATSAAIEELLAVKVDDGTGSVSWTWWCRSRRTRRVVR